MSLTLIQAATDCSMRNEALASPRGGLVCGVDRPCHVTFSYSVPTLNLAPNAGPWPSYSCHLRSEQMTTMLQRHRYVQVHSLHVPSCRCRMPVRMCMLGQKSRHMPAALCVIAAESFLLPRCSCAAGFVKQHLLRPQVTLCIHEQHSALSS